MWYMNLITKRYQYLRRYMMSDNIKDKRFSRRDIIVGGGIVAAGAAVAGFGSRASASTEKVDFASKWPWPYVKLDPEETAEIAYNEWYRVFCGASVISSVFGQLAKKIGEPYTSFPIDAFIFLEGGVSGWGTICGSNAGSNIVTNLIIGPRISGTEDGMLMGSELMQWYSETALPVYVPKEPRIDPKLIPRTVSDSPLCHISVGKWMKEANKELGSPERKDRCARVTATMAYEVVSLLNDWKDGDYITFGEVPSSCGITAQYNCNECHGDNIPDIPTGKPAVKMPEKG
jgi:hypothetical protein